MESNSGVDFGAPDRERVTGWPAAVTSASAWEPQDGDVRPEGRTSALIQAEALFAAAGERLRSLMMLALTGTDYDPDTLDAAILTYRGAQARAVNARVAWLRWQAGRVATAA